MKIQCKQRIRIYHEEPDAVEIKNYTYSRDRDNLKEYNHTRYLCFSGYEQMFSTGFDVMW